MTEASLLEYINTAVGRFVQPGGMVQQPGMVYQQPGMIYQQPGLVYQQPGHLSYFGCLC